MTTELRFLAATVILGLLHLIVDSHLISFQLPIVIGDGIRFFEKLDRDIVLHLAEVKAHKSGMVELRYEVRALTADGKS